MLLILFNRGGGPAPAPPVPAVRLIALKGWDGTAASLTADGGWPALRGWDGLRIGLAGGASWPAVKGKDSTDKQLEGDNG